MNSFLRLEAICVSQMKAYNMTGMSFNMCTLPIVLIWSKESLLDTSQVALCLGAVLCLCRLIVNGGAVQITLLTVPGEIMACKKSRAYAIDQWMDYEMLDRAVTFTLILVSGGVKPQLELDMKNKVCAPSRHGVPPSSRVLFQGESQSLVLLQVQRLCTSFQDPL